MLVKICGIKNKEAALVAEQAGVDFIGFVFAESKRKINPSTAAEIATSLPSHVKKVGVFVNETVDRMIEIAEVVGLDYIQLHGDEDAHVAASLPYPVIKAFSVGEIEVKEMRDYPCEYLLLDSPKGAYRGGNGITFDWSAVTELAIPHEKIILAGGLTADNVRQAIQIAGPIGVDVSSGVETNNEKDIEKIMQFITEAKKTRKDEVL
ncbi:phosphoribosylanthranilate isomerase [Oceanobacillus piezotolerans]|uniref:N-(5'-phosphoribosyl)anthranilate isomerase n=1 Tax=Oceanobacillus piezotolerans TaxID=2448030 RepID=A0A498D5W2_9BACI|nr:phosphoribosylanthranilate isomerase [Oceanobacillus piezotolerans]RLL42045.1 phosphoribosylanthranilate isomerase [Oceanobacillus piezotolerans]